MPDYRTMYDSDYIASWDLDGDDHTLEIERVVAGEVQNKDGKEKKPIVYFKGRKKGLVLNKTNGKIIAAICGSPNTDQWNGKSITLFATTTTAFGDTVECVRVRPTAPKAKAAK